MRYTFMPLYEAAPDDDTALRFNCSVGNYCSWDQVITKSAAKAMVVYTLDRPTFDELSIWVAHNTKHYSVINLSNMPHRSSTGFACGAVHVERP